MSDLISRQAAIDDAKSWVGVNSYEQHLQRNVIEWLKEFPSAEPERWNRLMMHLADLQLTYAPADGHGDAKLYEFVSGLVEELEGWTDGGGA